MATTSGAEVMVTIDYLNQLVEQNSSLVRSNGQVKDLLVDLEKINHFIKELEKSQDDNNLAKRTVSDIRGVVRQAEDAIEVLIFHYEFKHQTKGVLEKIFSSYKSTVECRNLEKHILEIKKNVADIYHKYGSIWAGRLKSEETTYNIGESKRSSRKAPFVDYYDMVGREDDMKKIIDLLAWGRQELEVISITGMLGVGKTTLALSVFHHPTIEYQFFVRAFVTVSHEYKKREIFLTILSAIGRVSDLSMKSKSDDDLAAEIFSYLEKTNFLIVMDDVCTREAWDELKIAFPRNRKLSRVLITTENRYVAIHTNLERNPYDLRRLYIEESKELLERRIFGKNSCPEEFEPYELRIVEKCEGLPLAIILVAGVLLYHRDRIDWWRKVADDVNNYISDEQGKVIRVSFDQLPHHLKLCLLYLGLFTEGWEIPVWRLLRLWVAEGLVRGDRSMMRLEELAAGYLDELVDRNLVMVGRKRADGSIKTCYLHSSLLNFCKEEAKKENFFQEINLSENRSSENCRRICVPSSVLMDWKSISEAKSVRSFLCFATGELVLPGEYISSIPKAFKLLRVLDVPSVRLTRFPRQLYDLILLRYLAISCDLKILPQRFSHLRNLQTLIILTSSKTLEIRADISKLTFLRHIHVNTSTYLGNFMGHSSANEHLQTLSTISPESCRKELFERTPNLKKLGLRGNIDFLRDRNWFCHLRNLEHLENLKLVNDDESCKLHDLPHQQIFPRKLTTLTLSNTWLDWKQMSTLGKLENLEVLKLKENAFDGSSWVTEYGDFQRLKVLVIDSRNLMVWKASGNHFPSLVSLFLRHCTKLESLPIGLADMPSLQSIDLYISNHRLSPIARKIQLLRQEMGVENFKVSVYPPDQ